MSAHPSYYLFGAALAGATALALSAGSEQDSVPKSRPRHQRSKTTVPSSLSASLPDVKALQKPAHHKSKSYRATRREPFGGSEILSRPQELTETAPKSRTALREALANANKDIAANAFSGFCDRLLMANKVWQQEKEIRELKEWRAGMEAKVSVPAKMEEPQVVRKLEPIVVDTSDLFCPTAHPPPVSPSDALLTLIDSISQDLEASQVQVLSLQKQLKAYEQQMSTMEKTWIKDNTRLRGELDALRRSQTLEAPTEIVEHKDVDSTLLDSLPVSLDLRSPPQARDLKLFATPELDNASDSDSDASTSTFAQSDEEYEATDMTLHDIEVVGDEYFSSARRMYSLNKYDSDGEGSSVEHGRKITHARRPLTPPSPSPVGRFAPSPAASPLLFSFPTTSNPASSHSSPSLRPLSRSVRHRRHSYRALNPNPVFLIQPDSPGALSLNSLDMAFADTMSFSELGSVEGSEMMVRRRRSRLQESIEDLKIFSPIEEVDEHDVSQDAAEEQPPKKKKKKLGMMGRVRKLSHSLTGKKSSSL